MIKFTLRVIGQACKKSEIPNTSCSCVETGSPFGGGLSALAGAAGLGETTFTRVVGLHAIAIAAKQGCHDDSLARAVLVGLQSEPPVDNCVHTVIGDTTAFTEMPCAVFDDSLNVVEAAAVAAVYFGRPAPFGFPPNPSDDTVKQFKDALQQIAEDLDERRHGATIAAAREALTKLGY